MCVLGFPLLSLSRCTVYIALVIFVCLKTVAVSLKFCKKWHENSCGPPFHCLFIFVSFYYVHVLFFIRKQAMFSHFLLRSCLCLLQRDKNCVFCSSWLQYSISHSLSTIQYVLVSQVQHQLQAEPQWASRSGSCHI